MRPEQIASFLDSTNLKLDSTDAELCALCDEAAESNFAAVCVYPADVTICSSILYNSPVKVCSVIAFPHGRSSLSAKRAEILEAREHGASEIDLVLNYHNLRAGEKSLAADEASILCETARSVGLLAKIIVETGSLKKKQKLHALKICEQAGAGFIQTATGFGPEGDDAADVAFFRKHRANGIGIKAGSGARSHADAVALIEAGAGRLGVTNAGKILEAARQAVPEGAVHAD